MRLDPAALSLGWQKIELVLQPTHSKYHDCVLVMESTAKTEESMADLQLEVCGGYLRFVSKEAVFY